MFMNHSYLTYMFSQKKHHQRTYYGDDDFYLGQTEMRNAYCEDSEYVFLGKQTLLTLNNGEVFDKLTCLG